MKSAEEAGMRDLINRASVLITNNTLRFQESIDADNHTDTMNRIIHVTTHKLV